MVRTVFQSFKDIVEQEIFLQKQNVVLLLPVILACGIGVYFSLTSEPHWSIGAFLLLVGVLLLILKRNFLFVAVLTFLLGFAAAQYRTALVYTPILSEKMDGYVEGRIERVEVLEKGVRLTLYDVEIEGVDKEQTPRKVRLKLWRGDGFEVGQRVGGSASLTPPPAPIIPRGFDFQRYMYFQGIGAVGFLFGPPDILEVARGVQFFSRINMLRDAIGKRLDMSLGEPISGFARALMVGQRASIPENDMEAIRAAGLAHMLAISGLHVGLFSGFIFFVVRIAMASFPSFALRYPIKKYAAVLAVSGAFFYMLVAGSTVPTQRAMITVAVVFFAILVDRSPFSLRVVAFAALCVLLFFPESLVSVSFQMSFAAVTGLVAFYEWTRPLWSQWSRKAGFFRKIFLYVGSVVCTTVVATFATAPFTLYHFQALPVYGLLANIVAVPILAFFAMPLIIVTFLFLPLGFESLPLQLMDIGLSFILELSHFVTAIEGAVFHMPAFSIESLLCLVLMGLALLIFKGHIRIAIVVLTLCGSFMNFKLYQYDVLISSKFDLISLRFDDPLWVVSGRRKSRFMRENWEQYLGMEGVDGVVLPKEGRIDAREGSVQCDYTVCRLEKGGYKLSYLRNYDLSVFESECDWADVVVSKAVYEEDCSAGYVLNVRDGYRNGVHAIKFGQAIQLIRSEDFRGKRPWVQR